MPEGHDRSRRWRIAMEEALYGTGGFYRSSGAPGRHFRTAAHTSPQWAAAVAELARRVDAALDRPAGFTVVDMGAGGGELLRHLHEHAPPRWRLVGVDLAPRPAGLPERVEWAAEPPPAGTGLLVAVEWLDVVPLDVVELTEAGPRLVEVDARGQERATAEVGDDDLGWIARWWPLVEPGDRAEVGRTRDAAWSGVVGGLTRGVAVAVDYAAVPGRDRGGTLTGYRDGRQVLPLPDGSCDLTAHVLMESCAAAAAADATVRMTQREALASLGVRAERPAYDGDPLGYLTALSQAGAAAELLDPGGLGGFSWLLQAVGVPIPIGQRGAQAMST